MTKTQQKALGEWLDETIKSMKYLAEGQLIAKAITDTQKQLEEVFPAEFYARNMGHQINKNLTYESWSCDTMFGAIIPDP